MGEKTIMIEKITLGNSQSFSVMNFQEALLVEKKTKDNQGEKKLS